MNQVIRASLNLAVRSFKLLGILAISACTAAEPSFSRQEITHIEASSYNPETGKIQFQIGHSAGCGTYYHYDYDVLQTNPTEGWAHVQVIVRTDNTCEAYLMQSIVMDPPTLSFPLQKIKFVQNGVGETLVLQ